MGADNMGPDKTNGFKSHIPRSMRTDNLYAFSYLASSDGNKLIFFGYSAKIIKMGAPNKKRGLRVADALRSDDDTLGQLARLYKPGKDTTESLAEDFDIALKTPVPDDKESTFGLVADHSFVSSDSGILTEDDFADASHVDTSYVEENHYDSLQKRSPAVLNPFYFDAIRISPSHGSGFGSARYSESAGSNNNLGLDFFNDADSDHATIVESAELVGTHPRDLNSLTFGIAGGAIALKRVQILDILMPEPGVLAELETADAREGKDSPFRSYYGHEPVLSDIQEETEPERDSCSTTPPSRVKNRHQMRSLRDSIAKMKTSPHACSSRTSDPGSMTPSRCRPSHDMENPLSRRFRRSSDETRGQQSSIISGDTSVLRSHTARGSLASIADENEDADWETESDNARKSISVDTTSDLGIHTAHGFLASIGEEKQGNDWWESDTDNSEGLSLFAAIKEPVPAVSTAFAPVEGTEVPLPFDVTTSKLQPLPITPEEEKRLLDEPRFVKDGVIPEEYIRFLVPPATSTPTQKWEPHRPDYPLRGSSHSATDSKGDAIFLGSQAIVKRKISRESVGNESEYDDELVNIFRKISEDFSDTALGKIADAYLSHALLSNVDQAIAVALNHELGVKGCPSIELLASAKVLYTIIGCVKHANDEAERTGNSKKAIEIYADIGGRGFVQRELDTVSGVVAKCLAQSQMEVVDNGVVGEGSSAQTTKADDGDPFMERPAATSNGQSGNNCPRSNIMNHAAWAQSILGSSLEGVAIAPFGFNSLASSLGMGSATLRGNIRGKEGLDLNNLLRDRSLFRFTGVGSIAPGTPAGEAARHPLPYVYHPFDGAFALIDEIVVGIAYAGGDGSFSSSSSSVDLNTTIDEIAAAAVAQCPYAGPNVFIGKGGAASISDEVAKSATNAAYAARSAHADTIETAEDTPRACRTPKRKPGGYSLFPAGAASPRTPSQAAEFERKESQDKLLPAVGTPASRPRSHGVCSILTRVPSISTKKKTEGSQGLLASLNKPLPVIAKDYDTISPALAAATDVDASPIFPGLLGLERTPVEKKQLGSMRRYGSKAIDTLKGLWSKSDQELAANQASDRERRKKTADRVINMARDYDESCATFPQPAAGMMMGMQAEDQSSMEVHQGAQRAMAMQAEAPILSPRARRISGTDVDRSSLRARKIYLQSLNATPAVAQDSWASRTALRTLNDSQQNLGSSSRITVSITDNVASPVARAPSRIPVPVRVSAFIEGVENVVPCAPGSAAIPATPASKKRGAKETIVSAMGFGSRRKSIGDNTRVNGA